MSKVITFGSLNMDLTIRCQRLPQGGETVEGTDLLLNPGGKGGNQAVAAARAGAVSHMIACVGEDVFGREMVAALERYGVIHSQVCTTSQSSTGMALITRYENDNRIILNGGANQILTAQQVCESLDALATPGDLFVTQFECQMDTTFAAIAHAHAKGMFTVVNPAPAKPIPHHVYPHIDLLVLNQSETEFLTGIPADTPPHLQQAVEWFRGQGLTQIIITLGGDGSLIATPQETYTLPAHHVPVVDTTAAGDTYIGALAASLATGMDLRESTRFATAAAALTIGKTGAQQSIPSYTEIIQFMEEESLC